MNKRAKQGKFFLLMALIVSLTFLYSRYLNKKIVLSPTVVPSPSENLHTQIIRELTANGLVCNELCRVDKVEGDYAKGLMPQAYWLAKKIEGKWKAVVTGNGIPQCGEIDTYALPKEIYGNCIESSGELRF